jgi:hypothetical protein
VAIFNVTAMHVAVVPILPTLAGSGSTWWTISGWLLVASVGPAAALTSAIASASAVVGQALVLRRGVDVAWGLLADSHAELLYIGQLVLHCDQSGCLVLNGFLCGHVRGTKVCHWLVVWWVIVDRGHAVAMLWGHGSRLVDEPNRSESILLEGVDHLNNWRDLFLHAIQFLNSSEYILHCLMMRSSMLMTVRSFIGYSATLV